MTVTEPDDQQAPLQAIISIPDRDTLMDMMETLAEADLQIQTEDITHQSADGCGQTAIYLEKLTDKQRHTVEIALHAGYYEQPRRADLTDLSDTIGISKSAVSQRLRAAETKIIKQAFGQYR